MTWVYNLSSPDPNTEVPRVIAICLVFPVLSLIAVAFRFFVRLRLKRTPWVDDYTALSSAVLVSAYGAVTIARTLDSQASIENRNGMEWIVDMTRNTMGTGLARGVFPRGQRSAVQQGRYSQPFEYIFITWLHANCVWPQLQYAGGPIYTMALLGFKVSLLAAYIRIGGFVKTYKMVLIVAIVACVCNQLAFTLLLLFACRPVCLYPRRCSMEFGLMDCIGR